MKTISISRQDLCENPFVKVAESALAYWDNPYPDVRYEFDGNEVFIDYEYYTLDPDVQQYLEDIKDELDNKPLRDVEFAENKRMIIIDADELESNAGLSEDDDDYEHNGQIKFEVGNETL